MPGCAYCTLKHVHVPCSSPLPELPARVSPPASPPPRMQARASADSALAQQITEISAGLGDAQDAASAASREVVNARAELDTLDVDIAEQSALVSEHDMRLTALRGTAEAAQSALAAVRGAVLRQENALEAADERRREAAEALEQIDTAQAPEGSAAEHSAAYETAQREATEAETELEGLRERLH